MRPASPGIAFPAAPSERCTVTPCASRAFAWQVYVLLHGDNVLTDILVAIDAAVHVQGLQAAKVRESVFKLEGPDCELAAAVSVTFGYELTAAKRRNRAVATRSWDCLGSKKRGDVHARSSPCPRHTCNAGVPPPPTHRSKGTRGLWPALNSRGVTPM